MAGALLASLVRVGRCFVCGLTGCDAWLWATDGTGLHPVHADCLAKRPSGRAS